MKGFRKLTPEEKTIVRLRSDREAAKIEKGIQRAIRDYRRLNPIDVNERAACMTAITELNRTYYLITRRNCSYCV